MESAKEDSKLIVANVIDLKYHGNQDNVFTYEIIEEIAAWIRNRTQHRPKLGVICGSGLGPLAETIEDSVVLTYDEIPCFPVSTVKSHSGKLVIGILSGVPTICMQGRFHHYEGYPLWKCTMPVRVMKLVGVTHLIVSNAAGGLNPRMKVGDLMIIKDHINLMGFAGNNPLMGTNDERFGTRFPAMSKAYSEVFRRKGWEVAKKIKIEHLMHEGVYAALGGPNFETIAELRMLRICGVDAVGMSTVPEVITAIHCGMTVFAFSLVTNKAVLEYDVKATANHEEVIEAAKAREKVLKTFVVEFVHEIRNMI